MLKRRKSNLGVEIFKKALSTEGKKKSLYKEMKRNSGKNIK